MFVWHRIHFRRLDYSTDPGMCLLLTTKVHVALGAAIGVVTASTLVAIDAAIGWILLVIGWSLFLLYTVRNYKHVRKLRAGFVAARKASPSAWYSSCTRQQVQLHVGMAFGRLCAVVISVAGTAAEPVPALLWPLRALSVFSLLIGVRQLSLPPLPENARDDFARWDQQARIGSPLL